MKYITFDGDTTKLYKRNYNTNCFTEQELCEICSEWEKDDDDGTYYYLKDDNEQ